ncbi:MobF family relaxase [Rhodopirellula bahusiensis]|uniref:MobF family relaxase n=1 Tax=Rhodopirellula bahusiensis TaxID=2014065 RepID=UPI003264E122
MQQSENSKAAVVYFDGSLSVDDYFLSDAVKATWSGRLCPRLGIKAGSTVEREQFVALLEGKHPVSGSMLSQKKRSDRRPCIDLTVSCPKSVSLALIDNPEIETALMEATEEFLQRDVEPLVHRRVRNGKFARTHQQKQLGEAVFAKFLHRTARPTEIGPPDVHAHVHCLAFNVTHDGGKWFAAEMERVVSQRGSLQAKFEARLANRLVSLGFETERVSYWQSGKLKHGWELKGIDRAMIESFSKRGAEIEKAAKEAGFSDAVSKRGLAQKTRKRKSTKPCSFSSLKQLWRESMTTEQKAAMGRLRRGNGKQRVENSERLKRSVKHAIAHCFERSSTVETHELVAEALRHGVSLQPESVQAKIECHNSGLLQRTQLIDGTERRIATTPEILETERETIAIAREARGTKKAVSPGYQLTREYLNEHQQSAVKYILESRDGVLLVSGGAGTGKSTMLAEAKEGAEAAGVRVFAAAPSTAAVDVLRDKGFADTQTVEHWIRNQNRQADLRDQLLFVDEAGLMDMRSCHQILKIARDQNCRVVLIGDAKQHGTVGRGESFSLLQKEAGLRVAKLAKIQRQSGDYKRAVAAIARGLEPISIESEVTGIEAGFQMLCEQEKVHVQIGEDPRQVLIDHYFEVAEKRQSAIIVAPTHLTGNEITERIRERLKADGKLGESVETSRLVNLNLTQAQRADPQSYQADDLQIQFTQNAPGIRRGSRYRVCRNNDELTIVSDNGSCLPLPFANADRFEVYRNEPIELAVGDRVRLTMGGKDERGKRLVNGKTDMVEKVFEDGSCQLKSGTRLSASHGHIAHAYTATSYRAQGADADVAIVALDSRSLPAVHARSLYVAASRGKKDLAVYCDDLKAVRRAIHRSGYEQTATELVRSSKPVRATHIEHQQREQTKQRQAFAARVRDWWSRRFGKRANLSETAQRQFTLPNSQHNVPRLGI